MSRHSDCSIPAITVLIVVTIVEQHRGAFLSGPYGSDECGERDAIRLIAITL